jgi:hypothetical protein
MISPQLPTTFQNSFLTPLKISIFGILLQLLMEERLNFSIEIASCQHRVVFQLLTER